MNKTKLRIRKCINCFYFDGACSANKGICLNCGEVVKINDKCDSWVSKEKIF